MRLVYQIPLVTTTLLIFTIALNIGGLSYFTDRAFLVYQEETRDDSIAPDPAVLDALANIDKLSPEKQEEYAAIIRELSTVSTALEDISQNPELYANTGTLNAGIVSVSSGTNILGLPVLRTPSSYFIDALRDPMGTTPGSPERDFVLTVLRNMSILNLLWLCVIVTMYIAWTRRIFRPIGSITDNIRKIINKGEYSSTRYARKDEFTPLISTINNLQKSLSIQEQIRSNFLSDLSHEIRTPITAVKCYLEGIEDGVMKLDEVTIPLLQGELSRLATITEKMMEYEHLTHDIFSEVKVERFDTQPILESLIQEYAPQLVRSMQSITLHLGNDTMTSMDRNMFIQLAHNVFSNFIKYAGKNTTLDIFYEKTLGEHIFRFVDNGVGVPDDEIAFVKEKFYRVDKSRTGGGEVNMGIGLSIIDRIAKLHHGRLDIRHGKPKGVIIEVRVKR